MSFNRNEQAQALSSKLKKKEDCEDGGIKGSAAALYRFNDIMTEQYDSTSSTFLKVEMKAGLT